MRHSATIFIIVILTLFTQCAESPTNPSSNQYAFMSMVILWDEDLERIPDPSGAEVFLLGTDKSTVVDSNGLYTFTGLNKGMHSFRLKYLNYPEFFLYDVPIDGLVDTLFDIQYWVLMSPLPSHTFVIDSIAKSVESDSSALLVHFTVSNPIPKLGFGILTVLSSNPQQVDYNTGEYDTAFSVTLLTSMKVTTYSSRLYIWYPNLNRMGYQPGDSLGIRFYSLNSTSHYVDPQNDRTVYPYRGATSNLVSFIIP